MTPEITLSRTRGLIQTLSRDVAVPANSPQDAPLRTIVVTARQLVDARIFDAASVRPLLERIVYDLPEVEPLLREEYVDRRDAHNPILWCHTRALELLGAQLDAEATREVRAA